MPPSTKPPVKPVAHPHNSSAMQSQPATLSNTQTSGLGTISVASSVHGSEPAMHETMRADAAEDRLLRAMSHFSKVTPLANQIPANRAGSALIAYVEARNELDEPALWDDFVTTSPVQFLKAELKTPTQTAILERHLAKFEVGVPLINGSLNMKLLPDLTISKVQRDDLDCQEGDKIVQVDGIPVSNIEDLRIHLQGRQEITLVIENAGTPLFTIHDATTPYWEVTSVPSATSIRGSLKAGDLVLRINDIPVSGLDTRKALDTTFAKVSLLPSDSQLAQRIKAEGLMSFTTQARAKVAREDVRVDCCSRWK